jgi:glycosyltransferase involved in cell wall biosynthesis
MPRICILTQYFPPEMGAPQARLSELGERLVDLGWEVEVLTALPNYPTGEVFPSYDPREVVVEQLGRLRVVRVPLFTAKIGFVRRMRSYLSFAASATRHGWRACRRPDLLFVESPPLFIGYAARALATLWRCPYVFNVSDLWPESAIRMGVIAPGLATKMAERLELGLYRKAAAVTGQSTGIIDSVRARSGATRTAVITNGVDPSRFGPQTVTPEARALVGDAPGPVFTYAGLLGYAQGLDQILDLAARWPADVPGRFVLVGDGPERDRLAERIARERIDRVRLVEAQPRERIPAVLAASDVALICLGMSLPGAVPSKIYEAMAAGLPILLLADGEPARRIADAGCGIAVSPGQLSAAREAALQLARDAERRSDLGRRGRHAAETVYDRRAIGDRLDALLREVIAARAAA